MYKSELVQGKEGLRLSEQESLGTLMDKVIPEESSAEGKGRSPDKAGGVA